MRPTVGLWGIVLALCAVLPNSGRTDELRFLRSGELARTLDLEVLKGACSEERIRTPDALSRRDKTFHAFPLRQVLALGFGIDAGELERKRFLLRGGDGFVRTTSGARLLESGGYLAYAEDHAGAGRFSVLEPSSRDPGPFRLIWAGAGQRDPHRYPWTYQLVSIETVPLESFVPYAIPKGAGAESPVQKGFELFLEECIACHAINGDGAHHGPDLNVPRSIVEYRSVDQIKAFIRNPESFRYTQMPAYPNLSEQDLDALIAYFDAMKDRKHDPGRPAAMQEP